MGIAGYRNIYLETKPRKLWIQVFVKKMEVARVPPGRPSRTTSGTRTTGWEPLTYSISQERIQPVRLGERISVIFGSQVS